MNLNKHRIVPLILFLTVNTTLAAQITKPNEAVSNPTVCQWLTRNGSKLYLCGAISDVAAMVNEARNYKKPALPLDIPELNTQIGSIEALPAETAPYKVASLVLPNSIISIEPSSAISKSAPKDPSVTINAGSRGYMVQSLGQINEIKPKLIATSVKDFQLLKRRNRISLGVYSNHNNALRRQKKLAALGIYSELIDRSRKTTVQVPKKALKTIEPKKSKIKKRPASNSKGFLVASIDNASTTLMLLKVAKDKHFQVLHSAPYTNRVSLGIYNTRKFALIRQDTMQKYGIASVIINRSDSLNKGFASKAIPTKVVSKDKIDSKDKGASKDKGVSKDKVLRNEVIRHQIVQNQIVQNQITQIEVVKSKALQDSKGQDLALKKTAPQYKVTIKEIEQTKFVGSKNPKKVTNPLPSQAQLDKVIQLLSSN